MIRTDKKLVEALLQLKRPTNKKEAQSVLRLIATFQKWMPRFSLLDAPNRQSAHFWY